MPPTKDRKKYEQQNVLAIRKSSCRLEVPANDAILVAVQIEHPDAVSQIDAARDRRMLLVNALLDRSV